MQGQEPDRAAVIFGDDWSWREACPFVAIKPAEFARGLFDLRMLSGLPVDIIDRSDAQQPNEIDGAWALLWLAGEVACWAVELRLWVPRWWDGPPPFVDVLDVAWGSKTGPEWPVWWSEQLDNDYGRRNKEYWIERRAPIEALCGRVSAGVSVGRAQ